MYSGSYRSGQAAAFTLDAADGRVDGTYFGNRVVAGPGFATTTSPFSTVTAPTYPTPTSYPTTSFPSTTTGFSTNFPTSFPSSFPTSFPTSSSFSSTYIPPTLPTTSAGLALDASDGRLDGRYFGSKILDGSATYQPYSTLSTALTPYTSLPTPLPTTSAGLALDASDGRIDGRFFGSRIIDSPSSLVSYGNYPYSQFSYDFNNVRVIGEREVRIRVPVLEDIPLPRVQVVDVPVPVPVPQIVYVEKAVYVDKPIEKTVYVDKPEERIVYIDKPAPIPTPAPRPAPSIFCASCNQAVTADLFEAEGRSWHRSCYTVCSGCGRFIEKALLLQAEGRNWHRDCYKICGSCGRMIQDQPFKFGGKVFHKQCMNICGGCMAVIDEVPYVVGGRKFHRSCYNGKWTGRDIYVIIDSSASMASQDTSDPQRRRYWHIARDAVMNHIVTKAVQYDSDGITLYFFDSKFTCYQNVNSPQRVSELFAQYQPTGGTALDKVLHDAFTRHFNQQHDPRKPATLLIITDGAPDSREAAERELINAAMNIKADYELSIMFVQIGPDPGATEFLRYLDEGMSKKTGGRDIVDVVKSWEMKGFTFEELIAKSIAD